MNEKHKIDRLFKEALQDYRDELQSDKTEELIFRKLSYNKYLRLLKISLGILSIAIPLTLLAYLVYFHNAKSQLTLNDKYNVAFQKKPDYLLKTFQNIQSSETKPRITNKTLSLIKSKSNESSINKAVFLQYSKKQKDKISEMQLSKIEEKSSSALNSGGKEIKNESRISNANSISLQPKTIHSIPQKQPHPFMEIDAFLKQKAITIIPNDTNTDIIDANKNKPITFQKHEDDIKNKTKLRPLFSIELSANLFYVDKNLKASNEFLNLVNMRNDNESDIYTFSPGVEIICKTKHFFVQTGIRYLRLGEKIKYNLTNTGTDIQNILLQRDTLVFVYSIISPPQGQWHYDTIWYTRFDTTYFTTHQIINSLNTYNYFEIPLLLGKSLTINKFNIDISTGISLGILLKANAQIIISDGRTFLNINNRQSPYMNDMTMNYLLRLSLRYSINEKWSVFIRPDLKHQFGSIINKNQYPVQQKYTLYGLGIGFMYNF